MFRKDGEKTVAKKAKIRPGESFWERPLQQTHSTAQFEQLCEIKILRVQFCLSCQILCKKT